jgi:hypothetical protein
VKGVFVIDYSGILPGGNSEVSTSCPLWRVLIEKEWRIYEVGAVGKQLNATEVVVFNTRHGFSLS